jgi:hypothetical protein
MPKACPVSNEKTTDTGISTMATTIVRAERLREIQPRTPFDFGGVLETLLWLSVDTELDMCWSWKATLLSGE